MFIKDFDIFDKTILNIDLMNLYMFIVRLFCKLVFNLYFENHIHIHYMNIFLCFELVSFFRTVGNDEVYYSFFETI
jgi:hypothetical protein